MERYITEEQIRQAEEFTRVYQSFGEEHAAAREAACLAAQYPAVLLPIGEEDLFAGRVEYGIVGFAPKNGEGFGYYCQDNRMREFVRGEGRKELRDRTARLLSFWENRCSRARTRAAFPEDMTRALPEDNLDAPGAAFPLYRMAGWVPDYRELMRLGIPGLKEKIREREKDAPGEQEKELFDAMSQTLDLVSVCAKHYAAQIDHILAEDEKAPSEERRAQLLVMRNSLAVIPERPPRTMHEALQLAWLYSLLAVTMDYGRMDDYIGPFYAADLEEGRITQEQALGLLCSLWTLIADTSETVHGRIVIGGRGRADEAAADRFALIAMEASRRVRRSIPQLSLRLYEGCNPLMMDKALEALGEGRTFPILYYDDVNIPSVMKAFGVKEEEAVDYYPFGCGEYVLGHRSFGSPNGLINMLKVLELALFDGVEVISGRQLGPRTGDAEGFRDFEGLYQAFLVQCRYFFHYLALQQELEYRVAGEEAPYLLQSILYDDRLARGRGMFQGGVRYLGGTVETYGNISASDSLYAIRRIVYEEGMCTIGELKEALRADYAGHEELLSALRRVQKFGNDDEGADGMAVRMHEDICRIIQEEGRKTSLASYLAVLINNDHNVRLGRAIGASADGRRAYAPMSNANGPTAGWDTQGITALLNSMTKLRTDIHAGAVQNMKFSRNMFREHRETVKGILETYFEQGGQQAMLNVVDRNELEAAMKEPEKYQDLFVRVGGYSGRFVQLPKEVQLDILNRTLYE